MTVTSVQWLRTALLIAAGTPLAAEEYNATCVTAMEFQLAGQTNPASGMAPDHVINRLGLSLQHMTTQIMTS